MKKLILLITLFLCVTVANAQLNKRNMIVGSSISDLRIDFDNQTSFQFTPKAAYFLTNDLAIGAYGQFGVNHTHGQDGSFYTYGIGPMARYYFHFKKTEESALEKFKFYSEGNFGFSGTNNTVNNSTTNGLGFGFGPGVSYFITPSVALEASLKYEGVVGFGSTTYSNSLVFGIGFQIFIPSKKVVKGIKSL